MKKNLDFAAAAAAEMMERGKAREVVNTFLKGMGLTAEDCIKHVSDPLYKTQLAHGRGQVFTAVGETAAASIIENRLKFLRKL